MEPFYVRSADGWILVMGRVDDVSEFLISEDHRLYSVWIHAEIPNFRSARS